MKKANKILIIISCILLPFFIALLFCPIFKLDGQNVFGVNVIFGAGKQYKFSFLLFFTYLLPIISTAFLLIPKLKDQPIISFVLFILAGVLIIISPKIDSNLCELGFHLHPLAILGAIFSFLEVLLLLILINSKVKFSVYDLVECSMLIALAIGLDLPGVKIQLGANGGSISLTMLPLFILAIRQGLVKGFLMIGVVYGMITCLMDGWGLMTYPFDYLLGYGSLAFLGVFHKAILYPKNNKKFIGVLFLLLGGVLAITLRLFSSTLSGVILYEMDFLGSLIYNVSYVLPAGFISLIVLILLYPLLLKINTHLLNKFKSGEIN